MYAFMFPSLLLFFPASTSFFPSHKKNTLFFVFLAIILLCLMLWVSQSWICWSMLPAPLVKTRQWINVGLCVWMWMWDLHVCVNEGQTWSLANMTEQMNRAEHSSKHHFTPCWWFRVLHQMIQALKNPHRKQNPEKATQGVAFWWMRNTRQIWLMT